MGQAASRVAERDHRSVRDHLRRLLWLMSEESGGICWRAPEAMAEIVHRTPRLFSEYAPVVMSLLHEMAEEDLQHFDRGLEVVANKSDVEPTLGSSSPPSVSVATACSGSDSIVSWLRSIVSRSRGLCTTIDHRFSVELEPMA